MFQMIRKIRIPEAARIAFLFGILFLLIPSGIGQAAAGMLWGIGIGYFVINTIMYPTGINFLGQLSTPSRTVLGIILVVLGIAIAASSIAVPRGVFLDIIYGLCIGGILSSALYVLITGAVCIAMEQK